MFKVEKILKNKNIQETIIEQLLHSSVHTSVYLKIKNYLKILLSQLYYILSTINKNIFKKNV